MRQRLVVAGAYVAVVLVASAGQLSLARNQHHQDVRDDSLARVAFETTCARQNQNREAIRQNAQVTRDIISAVLPIIGNSSVAAQLGRLANETNSAEPVDCTYPPKDAP